MAAGAFYQDTALQQSARGTLEPVYLSQTVWSRQSAILAASETGSVYIRKLFNYLFLRRQHATVHR